MILLEDLTSLVLWLLFTIATVNFVFLCFMVYRRLARKRYYAVKDSARERFQHVIARFVDGTLTVEQAASLLEEASSVPELDALQEMLLGAPPEQRDRTTQLLFALGYVERWARQAFGYRRGRDLVRKAFLGEPPQTGPRKPKPLDSVQRLRFFSVPRALAVDHLGALSPALATFFATEALRDPAADVRRVAVSVLGRNRVAAAVSLLVQELNMAVEERSDVSLRAVKSALVCYQLDDLPWFVPSLQHANARVRFFVVDAIREICVRAARQLPLNKNDFSQPFYEAFVLSLPGDASADVRARSAGVIRYFRDATAITLLRRLMTDENEFVRLHATRAAADRVYATLTPDLIGRVTDTKWRVREAAVQSLRAIGRTGRTELLRLLTATQDRYASEQITEEIQRGGLIEDVVSALRPGNSEFGLAEAACRKMVAMAKTSLLLNAMVSTGVADEARAVIMDAMATAPPPDFYPVLRGLAAADSGPLGMKAASLLTISDSRMKAVGPDDQAKAAGGAGA